MFMPMSILLLLLLASTVSALFRKTYIYILYGLLINGKAAIRTSVDLDTPCVFLVDTILIIAT